MNGGKIGVPWSAAVSAGPAQRQRTALGIGLSPKPQAIPTRCGWCSAYSRAPFVSVPLTDIVSQTFFIAKPPDRRFNAVSP
jgi:hypothetical protein